MDTMFAKVFLNLGYNLTDKEWSLFTYYCAKSLVGKDPREVEAREKGKLVAVINYKEIYIRLRMIDAIVFRITDHLMGMDFLHKKENWGVTVGSIGVTGEHTWLCESYLVDAHKKAVVSPPKHDIREEIEKALEVRRQDTLSRKVTSLDQPFRDNLIRTLTGKAPRTPASDLLIIVKDLYAATFKESYRMARDRVSGKVSYQKELKMWNVFLQYFNNEQKKAEDFVRWVFGNWTEVKKELKWISNPNSSLFATQRHVLKIVDMQNDSYVRSLTAGNRYEDTTSISAPSEGF